MIKTIINNYNKYSGQFLSADIKQQQNKNEMKETGL